MAKNRDTGETVTIGAEDVGVIDAARFGSLAKPANAAAPSKPDEFYLADTRFTDQPTRQFLEELTARARAFEGESLPDFLKHLNGTE